MVPDTPTRDASRSIGRQSGRHGHEADRQMAGDLGELSGLRIDLGNAFGADSVAINLPSPASAVSGPVSSH
jgi:hypothetical protein